MEEENFLPWWRRSLRALGILLGLVAITAVSMALMIFIARLFDNPGRETYQAPVYIDLTPAKVPEQNTALTRQPSPYGPINLPNSPGRAAEVRFKGSSSKDNAAPARGNGQAPAASTPIGVSVDEYRAATGSGKKVFLPDPAGKCDLSGANIGKSIDALEHCFAQQAAR